jgi:hypothetical protein
MEARIVVNKLKLAKVHDNGLALEAQIYLVFYKLKLSPGFKT